MRFPALSPKDLAKAIGVGVGTAVLLSAVMVPAFKLGISPLPKPLGLAFAETLLERSLPLPVGLLFHVAYVTFWAVFYVAVLRAHRPLVSALLLGLALWLIVIVIFFPVVGWGYLGLGVGPQLIVASLVPHLLFAVFLWGLCRFAFRPQMDESTQQ